PDGNVDTENVASLLVDDRINGNRGLSGLTVADDELALSASDRNHGVDRLDPGLKRFVNRLALDDTGGFDFNLTVFGCFDISFSIDRNTESVDNATEKLLAHGNLYDLVRTPDRASFLHLGVITQNGDTDTFFLKVQ